nr:FHA domain-containing protein PS1 [Ipomoea batatas]
MKLIWRIVAEARVALCTCFLKSNVLGGFAFIGEGILVATGAAFSSKFRREVYKEDCDHVTLAFFGDGTCNNGQFYECLNMAALQRVLPLLLVSKCFVIVIVLVHGAWIAGKRIEPGVRVELQEGDTMQLGGSSRVYRLYWMPFSRAYDLETPFFPPILESEPVKEGEGETNQDEDGFSHDDSLTKRDELEGLDSLHSDTDVSTMKSLTPSAPPLPEDINSAVAYEEKVECKTTNTGIHVEDKSNIGEPDYQLDKEDNMPQPSFTQTHSLAEFQTENAGSASLGSQQRPALNIWSRRGKASSVLIQISRDAEKSSRSGDMGEKVSTPDKENSPPSSLPLGSLKTTDKLNLKSGSTMKSSLLNVDEVGEIVTPDKENVTMKVIQNNGRDANNSSSVGFGSEIKSENNADTDIQPFSKDLFQIGDMGEKDFFHSGDMVEKISTPDKENSPPSSLPLGSLKMTYEFDLKSGSTMKTSLLNVDEVDEIVTPNKENITMSILCQSGGADEETFTPDKQMLTPNKEMTDEFDLKSGSIMKTSLLNVDEVDEIVTPDKENISMNILCLSGGADEETFTPDKQMLTPNKENQTPTSVSLRSLLGSAIMSSVGEDAKIVIPDKKNTTLIIPPLSGDVDEEEISPPDQGNLTPTSFPLGSLKNTDEFDLRNGLTMKSTLVDETAIPDKENITSNIHFLSGGMDEEEIFTPGKENCISSSMLLRSSMKTSEVDLKSQSTMKSSIPNMDEVDDENVLNPSPLKDAADPRIHNDEGMPFSLENDNCTEKVGECDDEIFTPDKENMTPNTHFLWSMDKIGKPGETKKHTWKANEDDSLLSMSEHVIRELDCMKRRSGFFRSTEVTSALEWVEDCMINTKWWFHVQSSEEEASAIPPTPPATPASLISYDSLLNIVSPTAEDHILEYALSFRKINNGQLVLLSDDVTLKIKSMAEGLLCETASDFRESLVNPFSERFLWADSSPRGTTWSSAPSKETFKTWRICVWLEAHIAP